MTKSYDMVALALAGVDDENDDQMYTPPEAGGERGNAAEVDVTKRPKASKDNLVISSFDKQRIMKLLQSAETAAEQREDIEDLVREIERGSELQPQEIPPDVVTMNSTVRVTDTDTGASHVYTIVFPADADYEKGKISILAPLGTALLGYRVCDTVDWNMPRGVRRLHIDEIIYQPEAAGDFHL
jgi:regulator of nucleoside diphosphate kinase